MIVGLLFIAIIWCLRGFLSYKQVVHNSCNMGTRGLPDIYTLSPRQGRSQTKCDDGASQLQLT